MLIRLSNKQKMYLIIIIYVTLQQKSYLFIMTHDYCYNTKKKGK